MKFQLELLHPFTEADVIKHICYSELHLDACKKKNIVLFFPGPKC